MSCADGLTMPAERYDGVQVGQSIIVLKEGDTSTELQVQVQILYSIIFITVVFKAYQASFFGKTPIQMYSAHSSALPHKYVNSSLSVPSRFSITPSVLTASAGSTHCSISIFSHSTFK
jgi:hypothetical protein